MTDTNIILPENMGEPHLAAAVVVDRSISMMGHKIEELNNGLKALEKALKEDPLACGRVEICVISFGSTVEIEQEFRPVSQFVAPELAPDGLTAMNEAVDTALDKLEERKWLYREHGIDYYCSWLFLLTDGRASDSEREEAVTERLRNAIKNRKVVYMPMGIGENADLEKLRAYYPPEEKSKILLKAEGDYFKEAFVWLGNSLTAITESDPNASDTVTISSPSSDSGVITVGI